MTRHRFERRGPLALAASAWGLEFDATPPPPPAQQGTIAVVQIRGPLTHHSDWFCDSYDAIKERVGSALASSASKVVLDIDSPGGDVSGCYETSRALRAMAQAAGKPLFAYANGMACSGGYALACAADQIITAAESIVGSIGVITMAVDMTEADRASGLNVRVIASGKRKADGNPHQALTDDAVEAFQSTVDGLAELFFELVSERRGVSVEHVRGLEAGVFHGARAVDAGLADGVATWAEFLAQVASVGIGGGAAGQEDRVDYKELVAALRAFAEGEDEEMAKKAKAALVAMGEEEPDGDEGKEKNAQGGEEKAEHEESDGDEGKEKAKASAPAAAASDPLLALAAKVHSLEAKITERDERDERARLLASRPDFSKEVLAVLKTAPLDTVRKAVRTFPRSAPKNPAAAAAPSVKPTAGEGQGDGKASRLPPEQKADLDARMGLGKPQAAIRREGKAVVFGVMDRDAARARVAGNGGDR